MKKVAVRLIYRRLLITIYTTLCVAGLTFQVVQISSNYFAFDVVSDINLINVDDRVLSYNLCFKLDEIVDKFQYRDTAKKIYNRTYRNRIDTFLLYKRFNKKEQLSVMIDPTLLFGRAKNYLILQSIGTLGCYQLQLDGFGYMIVAYISSIQRFWVSLSERLPLNDYLRYDYIKTQLLTRNYETQVIAYHHDLDLIKLPWPYVDDCMHYAPLGFINQRNAIERCYANLTMGLRDGTVVQMSDTNYLNMSWDYFEDNIDNQCIVKYHNQDCSSSIIYTDTKIRREESKSTMGRVKLVREHLTRDASFKIVSKPKVEKIDYFSFVLGTVGAWLGISALDLNPFSFFLSPQKSGGDVNQAPKSANNKLKNHGKIKTKLSELSTQLLRQKAAHDEDVKILYSLIQQMQHDKGSEKL